MNIVKINLKEVYSVKDYAPKWVDKYPDRTFVLVNAKWNCYGHEFVKEALFDNYEWEDIKKYGYYFG